MDEQEQKKRHHFIAGAFEGPLDLLLYLIQRSEINIYDIPVSEITEQYLGYLKYATGINLENITEFYLMAATLLYIKSQMLLPDNPDFDTDAEDPRRELVEKLIEYQKFRKITDLMTEKVGETEFVVERSKKQRVLPFDSDESMWQQIEVWDLLKTFSDLMASLSQDRVIDLYGPDDILGIHDRNWADRQQCGR